MYKNLNRSEDPPIYDMKRWSSIIQYKNGDISLDEMIVISELYMMYGSRYDEVILDDYDRAIKGYRNWNDFRRKTQLFYLGEEHYIDKEKVLYNLIDKECRYLFDYNKSVEECRRLISRGYIDSSGKLIILLRLYHLKRYKKDKIIDLMNSIDNSPSYEPQRMALILSLMKTWSYGSLTRVISNNLTWRLSSLFGKENPEYDYDYILIPENEEDKELIEKFNKIY